MYNLNITSFPFQGALEFVQWLNTMKLEQETHLACSQGRERDRVVPVHLSDKMGWSWPCQAGSSSLQTAQLHTGDGLALQGGASQLKEAPALGSAAHGALKPHTKPGAALCTQRREGASTQLLVQS